MKRLAVLLMFAVVGALPWPRLAGQPRPVNEQPPPSRPHERGGFSKPLRFPPTRVTDGDFYTPATASWASLESGVALEEEDRSREPAQGWLNGLYLDWEVDGDATQVAIAGEPCPTATHQVFDTDLGGYSIPQPSYLPPGTFETEDQWGVACGTRILAVERLYELHPGGGYISIVRWVGSFAVRHQASATRFTASTIAGTPAVLLAPVRADGFGETGSFLRLRDGVLQIWGDMVPFDEIVRIAQSYLGYVATINTGP